ncbi:MAG: DNA methylase [Lachnospiraceae bacterium]|nr:DNA methylase [Lachnospiraceae bacterium]
MEDAYIAIDLKSFYASVECAERKLDPLTTCLLVADGTRTDKTICLAVSPALKSYGLPGRPRLFEAKQQVKTVNADRRHKAPGKRFRAKSVSRIELDADPSLEVDFITATPRMALYMKYSTDIYRIYLKYIAPEDIHVYSCDEVFIYATPYLNTYGMTAHELAMTMIRDVLTSTGITATAGIGTNLYLSKVAMDIVAKHMPADKDGVRIAELDEMGYRRQLWSHTPITDFWGVGGGIASRLAGLHLFTMGDIAMYSEYSEDSLYRTFGVNAELLIDHAWGWEPCTLEYVKSYVPATNSMSSGQVLMRPYAYQEAAIIVREMTDLLVLDLVRKHVVTDQITLTLSYEHFGSQAEIDSYKGEVHYDYYGRPAPRHAHGTANLAEKTSSTEVIIDAMMELFERIADKSLKVRRVNVCACDITSCEGADEAEEEYEQMDLFTDYGERDRKKQAEEERRRKENALQLAALEIKDKSGRNALLKGTNFLKGAMTRERNNQIGGHKA